MDVRTIYQTDHEWTDAGMDALYDAARPVGATDDELYYAHGCILFTRYECTGERDAMVFATKQALGRYVRKLTAE